MDGGLMGGRAVATGGVYLAARMGAAVSRPASAACHSRRRRCCAAAAGTAWVALRAPPGLVENRGRVGAEEHALHHVQPKHGARLPAGWGGAGASGGWAHWGGGGRGTDCASVPPADRAQPPGLQRGRHALPADSFPQPTHQAPGCLPLTQPLYCIQHCPHPATAMSKGKVAAAPDTTGGMWSRFSLTAGGCRIGRSIRGGRQGQLPAKHTAAAAALAGMLPHRPSLPRLKEL